MKKAVIAIGSNSTRLLVAECGAELKDRFMGRADTRLFMGLTETGVLDREAMEHTVKSVSLLKMEAQIQGAQDVDLLATSATRDAGNAAEFRQMILDKTGLMLRVIPGQIEASYAFRAAAGRENCIVIDVGGGSTEYSRGKDGEIYDTFSSQIGASRLLKKQDIHSMADAEKVITMAKEVLKPAAEGLLKYDRADKLIAIGGSCTTAVAIDEGTYFGSDDTTYRVISLETVKAQLKMLAPMSLQDRKEVPGLPQGRVMHMPHGLCILIATMELLGFDKAYVTGRTILDGYLLSQQA